MRTAFRLFSARLGGPAEQKAENGKVKIALIPCFFQPGLLRFAKKWQRNLESFRETAEGDRKTR